MSLVSTFCRTRLTTSRSRGVRPKAATTSGTISGGRASSIVIAVAPSASGPAIGEACSTNQVPLRDRTRARGTTFEAPVANRRVGGAGRDPAGRADQGAEHRDRRGRPLAVEQRGQLLLGTQAHLRDRVVAV